MLQHIHMTSILLLHEGNSAEILNSEEKRAERSKKELN